MIYCTIDLPARREGAIHTQKLAVSFDGDTLVRGLMLVAVVAVTTADGPALTGAFAGTLHTGTALASLMGTSTATEAAVGD